MRYKYPRTFHLPRSPGKSSDDKVIPNDKHFHGMEVVITEKMDGENTTMYSDYIHARSIDSGFHQSRTWIKNFHSILSYQIPVGYRICGENLYAKHSIAYDNLLSYFYAFSIWNDDLCLSWDVTVAICKSLGIVTVPVLYRGIYSEDIIDELVSGMKTDKQEGFVVRLVGEFPINEFPVSVAKYVRKDHVNTNDHWHWPWHWPWHSEIKINKLR